MVFTPRESNTQALGVAMPIVRDATGWLGPYYVGGIIDIFFLGVLSSQVSIYCSNYGKDSSRIKFLVFICVAVSIFKTVESFALIWYTGVQEFGDKTLAITMHWSLYLQPTSMVVLSTAAQTYFAWRCFNLAGRNWFLLSILGTAMLTVVALGVSLSLYLARSPHYTLTIQYLVIPMLIVALLVDVTITITVLRRLIKFRQGIKKSTDAFLKDWIAITWQCALPPALSQAADLFAFVFSGEKDMWHGLFNLITPRLYVFSLMYTLNARRNFHLALYAGADRITPRDHDSGEPLGGRQGFERTEINTLSTFKAKQRDTRQALRNSYCLGPLDDAANEGIIRESTVHF